MALSFVTQRGLDVTAIAILIRHGCVVDLRETYSELMFPEGTVKEEIWPRVGGSVYELVLPDGYKCLARYARYWGQFVIFYGPEV